MKIGKLAQQTNVSIRMIRYYEEQELITPKRLESGYREYSHEDIVLINRIRLLSNAGLKLDSIREILPCVRDDIPNFHPCTRLRTILREQCEEIDRKMEKLEKSRSLLGDYLDDL